MVSKFCCCGLRIGIIIYCIILTIFTIISFTYQLRLYSVDRDNVEQYKTEVITCVVAFIMSLLVLGFLIIGAIKRSRGFLLPYIIIQGLYMAISTCTFLYLIWFDPVNFAWIPITALFWYFWYCVACYYQYLNPDHPLYSQFKNNNDETAKSDIVLNGI